MKSLHLAAAGLLCAAGVVAGTAPAGAAPSPAAHVSPAAGCSIRYYFNQNSYLYLHPDGNSTKMGLAYAYDTFNYDGSTNSGFRHGTDARSGGATGWVRVANLSTQKVCD